MAIIVILAGSWFGYRQLSDKGCSGQFKLSVAAATEIAPAVEQVAQQWLATNRLAAGDTSAGSDRPDAVVRDDAAGRLPVVRRTWTDGSGRVLVEHHAVEGLGHAWSGGARGGSYTDPRGPSASAAIWGFFARVGAATPPLLTV